MNIRTIIGIILLTIAIGVIPLGYWLSVKWGLLALALGITGGLLLSSTVIRKLSRQKEIGASNSYPSSDLKGFNGADAFDGQDD